jgi:hypothetical protein
VAKFVASSWYNIWYPYVIIYQALLTHQLMCNYRNLAWLGWNIIKRSGLFKLNSGQKETGLGNVLVLEIQLKDVERLEVFKV